MPSQRSTELDVESIATSLLETVGESQVETIARRCGMVRRKREVTPLGMLVACLSTLGAGEARWLADILRTYNRFTGKTVCYKPFHNQLSKQGFPEFLRLVLEAVLTKLALPVLKALPQSKLTVFEDIILHDGTSFRLKDDLAKEWPGRFRKGSPAAVEVHVSMSAFEDNPLAITLAPDKEAERQFGPRAESLRGCLVLEDRGYEDRRYFSAVNEEEGYFIVRGTKGIKPTIRKAYDKHGHRLRHLEGKRLSWKRLPRKDVDMEIEWDNQRGLYEGRLVAIYKQGKRNKKTFVYLHTNLGRKQFCLRDVGRLYRLRWQIELLFKEWKSYASLRRFDTSKSTIAEGLIWASLLTATLKRYLCHAAERLLGVELSTQRVAASARHFLDDILRCLFCRGRGLRSALKHAFEFMRENTRRAHPRRDRDKGRLELGLRPVATLSTNR